MPLLSLCVYFSCSVESAVYEELNSIIENSNFFSVLTDGSQARKIGNDKELVIGRAERNGKILTIAYYWKINH